MAHFRLILTPLFALLQLVYCFHVEFRSNDEETYRKYYNYTEFTHRIQRLAEKYPDICRLTSVGRSSGGRELWVMRVTAHTNLLRKVLEKPRVRYMGNIYRDDLLSRQVLIYFTDHLLSQYGSENRVTELVDTTDIYIIPSLNPDHFEEVGEGDCNGSKDPDAAEAAPEMLAVIQWFVLGGNLFGGSVEVGYSSESSSSQVTPGADRRTDEDHDDALFRYLVQTFTENRSNVDPCLDEQKEKFKSGATDVQGSTQDFSYFRGNCLEVPLQLGCCKFPPASELYPQWRNNRDALLAYMEKVHIGVRGHVLNSSGMGIPGSNISVAGTDHIITAWTYGDYYRLLLPGMYNITASSLGYLPCTINNVTVIEGEATVLNFILKKPSEEVLMPGLPATTVPVVAYQSTEPIPEPAVQKNHFSHHGYSDLESYLQWISSVYSSRTQLYSIGQSVLGRELYVMKISTNVGIDEAGKPEIAFVGNFHGDDAVGQEILLRLVNYLCSNYGGDPLITQLVNSTRVHILPSVNPDDSGISGEETINEHGDFGAGLNDGHKQIVDLSRNFPDQVQTEVFVRPETKAVMNWMKAHSFVLSASVLGGVIGVKFPASVDSIDEAVFESVTRDYLEFSSLQMSQTCQNVDRSEINHAAAGGMDLESWAYDNTDALGIRIGVSCDLRSPAENVTTAWIKNQRSLLRLIQQVHFSVRGSVIDSSSSEAIANATIEVKGSRHRVHTSSLGEYWRPLSPGIYRLHVFASGYLPLLATVTVTQPERVDFRLTRDQQPQSENQIEEEEEEFQRLVENLSVDGGLEQLVQTYLPARTLHYRKHTERSEFLHGLHLNFPSITRLYSLGNSWESRPIWALEISGSPESTRLTVPGIRYVAGVHGNAAAGPELLLEFASVLCLNYGRNPAITKLIDRSRIVMVPCVNPDGRELAQEDSCFSTSGLTNARSVDLDSDFIYGNTSAQPETRAMMNLMAGGGFSLSLSLDGGSLLTAYPYDRPTESAHNEETLRYLASVYASNHPVMRLGYPGCRDGLESVPGGILRGAELRGHMGSMKDFSVDVGSCPEITVYTGCCLYPPAQQLLPLWAEHRTALLAMLLEIHKGLSGVVKDNEGRPVSDAAIMLNGSEFARTDVHGFFHTLLAPGTQQLQVQASGFDQQLLQVNVSSSQKAGPVLIQFSEKSRHGGQGLVLAAANNVPFAYVCIRTEKQSYTFNTSFLFADLFFCGCGRCKKKSGAGLLLQGENLVVQEVPAVLASSKCKT
ncbi:Carboxypeptidase D [Bagarius yarrelli]|uniref:Carboxypeptidase D n=1 Tax=Bagarius yarrelli TaxID=175774 RepID=A0A556UYJ1_BAGYA|nr:Carboxypeptidase D [Bagarius yarrelli]